MLFLLSSSSIFITLQHPIKSLLYLILSDHLYPINLCFSHEPTVQRWFLFTFQVSVVSAAYVLTSEDWELWRLKLERTCVCLFFVRITSFNMNCSSFRYLQQYLNEKFLHLYPREISVWSCYHFHSICLNLFILYVYVTTYFLF